MTEDTPRQSYFTEPEIGEIATSLMEMPASALLKLDTKTSATVALNAVRIMRDRLNIDRGTFRFIYLDSNLASPPLKRFITTYLADEHTPENAAAILDRLQEDMRAYYEENSIPYGDPDEMPTAHILDFSEMPGLETRSVETATGLLGSITNVVRKYEPAAEDPVDRAQEIYDKSCQNLLKTADVEVIVRDLATIVARQAYPTLVVRLGLEDPSPEDLARCYVDGLEIAYRELGFLRSEPFDKAATLEERVQDATYQEELDAYRKLRDGLSLGG